MSIESKIEEIIKVTSRDNIEEIKNCIEELDILGKKLKVMSKTIAATKAKAIQKIDSETKRLQRAKKSNIIKMSPSCWDVWDIVNENISINEQTAISYRGNFLKEIGILLIMKNNEDIRSLVKSMTHRLILENLNLKWHEKSVSEHVEVIKRMTITQLVFKYAPELKDTKSGARVKRIEETISIFNATKRDGQYFIKHAKRPEMLNEYAHMLLGWGDVYDSDVKYGDVDHSEYVELASREHPISQLKNKQTEYDATEMKIIPQALDYLREYDKKVADVEDVINNELLMDVENNLLAPLKQMAYNLDTIGITTRLTVDDNAKLKIPDRIYLDIIATHHRLITPIRRILPAVSGIISSATMIAITDGSNNAISVNPKWLKVYPQKDNEDIPNVTDIQDYSRIGDDFRDYGVEANDFT